MSLSLKTDPLPHPLRSHPLPSRPTSPGSIHDSPPASPPALHLNTDVDPSSMAPKPTRAQGVSPSPTTQADESASRRPHVYVRLEFGVSVSSRQRPKRHSLTYVSKNWRDNSNFPRQVPSPTTNYLAPDYEHHQQAYQLPQLQHSPFNYQPAAALAEEENRSRSRSRTRLPLEVDYQQAQHSQLFEDQEAATNMKSTRPAQRPDLQTSFTAPAAPTVCGGPSSHARDEERRSSQQSSRPPPSPLHERGSSAPPPWNLSPWDAHVEPAAMGFSALPTKNRQQLDHEQQNSDMNVWKDLPPVPTSFRLSEGFNDGHLAWTPFTWPSEYGVPDDDETYVGSTRPRTSGDQPMVMSVTPASRLNKGVSDTGSGKGTVRDLGDLSTAMMTVDNGFETQWWYQGKREEMARQLETGEIFHPNPPEPQAPNDSIMGSSALDRSSSRSVGWAIAQQPMSCVSPAGGDTLRGYNVMTVSPITDISSPRTFEATPRALHRTLTTRSDELFISV